MLADFFNARVHARTPASYPSEGNSGLGSLEQGLVRDGNVGAVVKSRAGKGFARRIEHGADESTSAGKSGVVRLGQA